MRLLLSREDESLYSFYREEGFLLSRRGVSLFFFIEMRDSFYLEITDSYHLEKKSLAFLPIEKRDPFSLEKKGLFILSPNKEIPSLSRRGVALFCL